MYAILYVRYYSNGIVFRSYNDSYLYKAQMNTVLLGLSCCLLNLGIQMAVSRNILQPIHVQKYTFLCLGNSRNHLHQLSFYKYMGLEIRKFVFVLIMNKLLYVNFGYR